MCILLGVVIFGTWGILWEFSRTQWHSAVPPGATILVAGHQTHPAWFARRAHRFTRQEWWSREREVNSIGASLNSVFLLTACFTSRHQPSLFFFFPKQNVKKQTSYWISAVSLSQVALFKIYFLITVINHIEHGEYALTKVKDVGVSFKLSDGSWLCSPSFNRKYINCWRHDLIEWSLQTPMLLSRWDGNLTMLRTITHSAKRSY